MNNNSRSASQSQNYRQQKYIWAEQTHHQNSNTSNLGKQPSFGNERDFTLQQSNKIHDPRGLRQKLSQLNQRLYEVVFLKDSVISAVGQQRIKMGDFMRDLKKYLFQLQIKIERQTINKTPKQGQTQPTALSRSALQNQQISQLQQLCQTLTAENQQLRHKYEQMLVKYQQELQILSQEITPHDNQELTRILQQNRQLRRSYQDIEETLRNQQIRFVERVKYLQSEILQLSEDYLRQKQTFQATLDNYRQKQREFSFREAEIERKNILLIERERLITERQIMVKHEKTTLDHREIKLSDYEQDQIRRERFKNQQDTRNLRSSNYVGYDRIADHRSDANFRFEGIRYPEREKSTSSRQIHSKLDINARLREIQLQRKRTGLKSSRISEAGRSRLERSSSRGRNHFMGFQVRREAVSGENVNIKLESMLQLMQRDLNDIK